MTDESHVRERSSPMTEYEMEEYILGSPISVPRKESFFRDYVESREACGALEIAFEHAGALRRTPEWDEGHAVGFNVIVRKGPFVEGSNYGQYRGWGFALALERFLLKRFEEAVLESSSYRREPTDSKWRSMLSVVDTLSDTVGAQDPATRLIVVSGALHENWVLDLARQQGVVPDWDLPSSLNRTWILGTYQDSLILHIGESEHRAVHVISIPAFATLLQYGSPRFEVDTISEPDAERLIRTRKEKPTPQRIREFRLKVWMRLYESWHLEKVQQAKAASARVG
jgi:hypothetical protein